MHSDRVALHWEPKNTSQYAKQTHIMDHCIWLTKLSSHMSLLRQWRELQDTLCRIRLYI